jgi:hypothetical protein
MGDETADDPVLINEEFGELVVSLLTI